MVTKEALLLELENAKAELILVTQSLRAANDKYAHYHLLLKEEGLSEQKEAKYVRERTAAERQQELLTRERDPWLQRIRALEELLAPSALRVLKNSNHGSNSGMVMKEALQLELENAKAELTLVTQSLRAAKAKYDRFDELLLTEGLSEEKEAKYVRERTAAMENRELLTKERDPWLQRIRALEELLAAFRQQELLTKERDPLLPRIMELEKLLAPSALRVLKKSNLGSNSGIVKLFLKQLNGKRRRIDSEEVRDEATMEFSTRLFDESAAPSTVYIRDCYREEAKRIHLLMGITEEKSPEDRRSVFIGGTPGVGKSILGVMMTFEFVDSGHAVVYEHKNTRLLIIGNNLRDEQRAALEVQFTEYGYEHVFVNPGVYEFLTADTDLFNKLVVQDDPIHVQDFGDGSTANELLTDGKTRRLMLSSPCDERLGKLHKLTMKAEKIIMPRWTLEELQKARELCFPNVKPEDVIEGFAKFGGVARHVLEYPLDRSMANFEDQLSRLTLKVIQRIMSSPSYENLPSFNDVGYLVHVIPAINGRYGACASTFASSYAFSRVMQLFLQLEAFKVKHFALLLKQNDHLGALYGIFLEEIAHRCLSKGEQTFQVHELVVSGQRRGKGSPTESPVVWPSDSETVFFDHLSDISEVFTGTYYRPRSRIYETIDSFMLIQDGSILNKKWKGPLLLLFQVTVSNTHTVNGAKVKEIYEEVSKRWKGAAAMKTRAKALSLVLVFATRRFPKGIHTYQNPTTSEGGKDAAGNAPLLAEYSLVLEQSFEDIWVEVDRLKKE